MDDKNTNLEEGPDKKPRPQRAWNPWLPLLVVLFAGTMMYLLYTPAQSSISYSYFNNLIDGKKYNGEQMFDEEGRNPVTTNIESVEMMDNYTARGTFIHPPEAEPRFDEDGKKIKAIGDKKLNRKFTVQIPQSSEAVNDLVKKLEDKGINLRATSNSDWLGLYSMLFSMMLLGLLLFMLFSFRRSQNPMMGGGGFPFQFH